MERCSGRPSFSYTPLMAPPKRVASPGSVAAITEDLHFARDASGIMRAEEGRLQATLSLFDSVTVVTPADSLTTIRSLLIAHTVRTCRQQAQASPADPRVQAATHSVRTILIQSANESEKAATIRRRALREHGCSLTLDGLRKREDGILRAIAESVWEDLRTRKDGSGPNTIEELILIIEPVAKRCVEALHHLLMKMYPKEASVPTDDLERLLSYTFYHVCHVLSLCRALAVVKARPGHDTALDGHFAGMALLLLTLPFGLEEDRNAVVDRFEAERGGGHEEFAAALDSAPGDLIDRCLGWFVSCYSNCAYHRTFNLGMLCSPHQFVSYLDIFVDSIAEFRSGELAEGMSALLRS